MLHLALISLMLLRIVSSRPLAHTELSNSSSLDARRQEDVDVQTIGPSGSPLFAKRTIIFFHLVMLEIYRDAVSRGRDAPIPEQVWERDLAEQYLQGAPREGSGMTWADVLWGLQAILRNMLYPLHIDGFREQRWEVGRNRKEDKGTMIKLGEISLSLEASESQPRVSLYNFSSSSAISVSTIDTSVYTLPPLGVPFPIPTTNIILLIGAQGDTLPQAPVIQALDGMVSLGYLRFANERRVGRIYQHTARISDASGTTYVTLQPRRTSGGISLLTATDVVEMAVGIVYYMVQNEFFATTITAVKPDKTGKRIAIGEMQIRMEPRQLSALTPGNASEVQVS